MPYQRQPIFADFAANFASQIGGLVTFIMHRFDMPTQVASLAKSLGADLAGKSSRSRLFLAMLFQMTSHILIGDTLIANGAM